jgi:Na+-translocating ferredoxin:NAD+ oxidoreductase RnfG subunit
MPDVGLPLTWTVIESAVGIQISTIHKEIAMRKLSTRLCLVALLATVFVAPVSANTSKLIIESGDSAQSRQNAAMDKEQWNDTRSLRHKVNTRAEKEWDKEDVAFDARDKCQQSANVNAYWEPNTLRCLDRRTGRTMTP